MAKSSLPKGRGPRIFIGSVAAVIAVTFGVTVSGLFKGGVTAPVPSTEKNAPVLPEQGAPKNDGANAAVDAGLLPSVATVQAKPAKPAGGDLLSPLASAQGPQSAKGFVVKRILNVDKPLNHGDYVWDDAGVPDGPVVITVDLKAQTLSVFRDGYEIGVSVILYGADDKPSPLGVYPIIGKDADHYSNLYNNAPMPYMLRLTWDGVAVHGSDVQYGEATHGCIGVPTAFAKKLFGQAKMGDIVIITDGKMMDLG